MKEKLLHAENYVDMRTGISYRYVLSDTERFRLHTHDYAEFFVVLEGQAKHIVGNTSILLQPRDLVLIRPHDRHDYVRVGKKAFSMVNITFTMETLAEAFSYLGDGFPSKALMEAKLPPGIRLTVGEFEAFRLRMKSINAVPMDRVSELKASLRILLFEVLTRYFSEFSVQTRSVPPWLESVCNQMRRNGAFSQGTEKLFSLTEKSREHVCRSMKKYMGVSVSEFVNDLRLNYISNMLRNSNHTVTEIVFESGFNNLSWAAELFRKKYGMTMSQYRKSL